MEKDVQGTTTKVEGLYGGELKGEGQRRVEVKETLEEPIIVPEEKSLGEKILGFFSDVKHSVTEHK